VNEYQSLRSDYYLLLWLASLFVVLGLLFIYSASSVYALECMGTSYYYLYRQFFSLCVACVGFCVCALTPLSFWRRFAPYLFLGALLLTVLTVIPGLGFSVHGARRWIYIYRFGIQPSELLKLFIFLYTAFFLAKRYRDTRSFNASYLPLLIVVGITSLILLRQPDFGSTVILSLTIAAMCFVAEYRWYYLLVTAAAALPVAALLVWLYPYRLQRIFAFLSPWSDPYGKGFQVIQSMIAIGSGGWCGAGIAYSKQKFFYLPMHHTDFIFSIIAEEVGFIGCVVLMAGYFLFAVVGLRIARRLQDPFASYATVGFIVCITLQAIINMMVATGLLPTKGLVLPFMSFGGSSLLVIGSMLGLIANFVRQERSLLYRW